MKKKISILCIIMVLACVIAGCGSAANGGDENNASAEIAQNAESKGKSESLKGDKTLVVYYSASGNTRAAAGMIAETANADLFEIVPAEPYSDDDLNWSDKDSRVSREHDDASLRAVALEADTVEGWEEYGTVFIGYPIWWGIAAWPVDGFVKANDFTGKTVIPFCTSASSDLGESGELLKEMAETGNWMEGVRFRSNASEADIIEWMKSLSL